MDNIQIITTYEEDVNHIMNNNKNVHNRLAECYVSNYHHKNLCDGCQLNSICKTIKR